MTTVVIHNPLTLVFSSPSDPIPVWASHLLTSHSSVANFVNCWVALNKKMVLPQTEWHPIFLVPRPYSEASTSLLSSPIPSEACPISILSVYQAFHIHSTYTMPLKVRHLNIFGEWQHDFICVKGSGVHSYGWRLQLILHCSTRRVWALGGS